MADSIVVRIIQGSLRGKKVTTKSGTTYYSFQGIPYAKPPVGSLRFKAPQPAETWEGVRDALTEGSVAPLFDDFLSNEYMGDEDCLFLNVYTPKLPTENTPASSKPVMVWVHGGGFYVGSGNSILYGPDHLIAKDIVLVTINYRLGALGFLSTGDPVIPGNNGLKDQVMALRWVQQNIAQFGGDPGNVTLSGESAGGASVHLHLLSPMSKGLFHRAIAQSGSSLNPWAYDDPTIARAKAFRFGEALGCKTTDSKELAQFLMKVPARELVEGMDKTLTEEEKLPMPLLFAPTADSCSQLREEIFLPDSPDNLISQGKFHNVPLMMGATSQEGMFVLKAVNEKPSWFDALNREFKIPKPHKFTLDVHTDKYKQIANDIKKFYFGAKPLSKDTEQQFVNLYSDAWFLKGIIKSIRQQISVSSAPIYFYNFAFDGKLGTAEQWLGPYRLPGACHGVELGYLFQMITNIDKSFDPEDDNMKTLSRMVKMWTNFVKRGNPTPEDDPLLGVTWKPVTKTEFNYLNIDRELSMKKELHKDRMDFWEKIYESLELAQS